MNMNKLPSQQALQHVGKVPWKGPFPSAGADLGIVSCWSVQSLEGYSGLWGMETLHIQVMCLLLICILMASLKQMQIEFQTKDITTAATVVNDPFFEN